MNKKKGREKINPGVVQMVVKNAAIKAGLDKNIHPHTLRHSFATRCIESGIPAVVLKTWLGHTDIHMTLDTYTDVFDSMDKDAIDKLDEHLEML